MKKGISLALILMSSVSSAMMAGNVISGSCGTGAKYALSEEGTLTFEGEGPMTDYSSNSNTPWYSHASEIKNIVFKKGVTSISANAFIDCTALTSVDFSESNVKKIGDYAFMNCSSLETIEMPNTLTNMGSCAFYKCTSLEDVTFSDELTAIPSNAFAYCYSLTTANLPEKLTTIDAQAFYQCHALNYLYLGKNIKTIAKDAFQFCYIRTKSLYNYSTINDKELENCGLTLCNSETKGLLVKNNVVVFCRKNATNVTINSTITAIEKEAFKDCASLEKVTVNSEQINSIGEAAFRGCTSLSSIYVPKSVTTIGKRAFQNCYMAKDNIKNSTSFNLADYALNICDLEQADGLLIKDNNAVYCRKFATAVNIPDYVNTISNAAFEECASLTYVTIPAAASKIESNTFSNCPLNTIDFHCAFPTIEDNAFGNVDGITVSAPVNSYDDYKDSKIFSTSYLYPSAGVIFYSVPTFNDMEAALANTDMSNLTAITFACEVGNDEDIISLIGKVSPNCMVYAKENSELSLNNMVTISTNQDELVCNNIVLTDDHAFQTPEMSVKEISYTHNPSVWADGKNGWETICLPFSPSIIKADVYGYIAPIVRGGNGNFWLRKYAGSSSSAAFFVSTNEGVFEANTPYLIAFPGKSMGKGNLEGQTILFAASNVTISTKDTDPVKKNAISFKGTYSNTPDDVIGYELNEAGSTFNMTATPGTHPFRAYFYNEEEQNAQANNVKGLNINFGTYDETTGIFTVEESTQMTETANGCFDMNGRQINESNAHKGVYVIDGKKVVKL